MRLKLDLSPQLLLAKGQVRLQLLLEVLQDPAIQLLQTRQCCWNTLRPGACPLQHSNWIFCQRVTDGWEVEYALTGTIHNHDLASAVLRSDANLTAHDAMYLTHSTCRLTGEYLMYSLHGHQRFTGVDALYYVLEVGTGN